jgi:hypothetical protein
MADCDAEQPSIEEYAPGRREQGPLPRARRAGWVEEERAEVPRSAPRHRGLPNLVSLADELGTGRILTLDSDFRVYRWRKVRRFELLVPLAA